MIYTMLKIAHFNASVVYVNVLLCICLSQFHFTILCSFLNKKKFQFSVLFAENQLPCFSLPHIIVMASLKEYKPSARPDGRRPPCRARISKFTYFILKFNRPLLMVFLSQALAKLQESLQGR